MVGTIKVMHTGKQKRMYHGLGCALRITVACILSHGTWVFESHHVMAVLDQSNFTICYGGITRAFVSSTSDMLITMNKAARPPRLPRSSRLWARPVGASDVWLWGLLEQALYKFMVRARQTIFQVCWLLWLHHIEWPAIDFMFCKKSRGYPIALKSMLHKSLKLSLFFHSCSTTQALDPDGPPPIRHPWNFMLTQPQKLGTKEPILTTRSQPITPFWTLPFGALSNYPTPCKSEMPINWKKVVCERCQRLTTAKSKQQFPEVCNSTKGFCRCRCCIHPLNLQFE